MIALGVLAKVLDLRVSKELSLTGFGNLTAAAIVAHHPRRPRSSAVILRQSDNMRQGRHPLSMLDSELDVTDAHFGMLTLVKYYCLQ
ncbi:MAG: hypothetical protein GPOALKHO_001040 [Sodalis sp.]|nr:MAG: hypothetical protein GPOALKHO_001040 [Sodalis sp.]